jgi:phosphoribosylpyrophosphate synthetase
VIVTNTVPHEIQKLRCHKIKTVDILPLLYEAIRRTFGNESMEPLFRDLTIDD